MDSTAIAGGIGTLIGALVGALGSYLGGIRGARENFTLINRLNQVQSKRLLITQLRLTVRLIKNIPVDSSINFSHFMYYDPEWQKHILYIDLSTDEFEDIILWYNTLETLEKGAQVNKGFLSGANIYTAFVDLIPQIETIIKKHGSDL